MSNKNTLKLRLTVDVEYDLNGVIKSELEDNLHSLVSRAYSECLFTGDSEATVNVLEHKVMALKSKTAKKDDSGLIYGDYVWSRKQKGKRSTLGLRTGGSRLCRMEACTGLCLRVLWPDGKFTWPCTKAMQFFEKKGWVIL